MKRFLLIAKFLLVSSITTLAQNVAINNTGASANASAMLDISSTTKGLLIPRMTLAQRTTIANPATGLQVYQTDAIKGFYYFDGNVWAQLGAAGANLSGWSTTGNAAIDATLNFIGTTDGQPFIGKANGEQVFRFSSATNNTLIGYQASHADSTGGTYNHMIGFKAGFNNSGSFNHFDGLQAGYNNEGNNNQFIGYNAGFTNISGNNNLFMGSAAGYYNSTGLENQFIGYQAGYNNVAGYQNYFNGYQAGFKNSAFNYNHFSGYQAGYNSQANDNQFEGYKAGYSNVSGYQNYFSGGMAGYSNVSGHNNHFSGRLAGYSNISGNNNYFSGEEAGHSNLADYNHFEGVSAGLNNTTGTENVFIGQAAGFYNISGSRNIYIGTNSAENATLASENLMIGYQTGFNTIASFNHFIGYRAGYTNTSGINNHFDGYKAGALNTTGGYNNFVGNQAGYSNSIGSSNVFLGYKAGFTNDSGNDNIFLGLGSGFQNYNGSHNTFLGQSAGHENISGNGNVAIGDFAGYNETGSNKLYIANSNTNNPLIYGEFDNKYLKIGGNVMINSDNDSKHELLRLHRPNYDYSVIRFTNDVYTATDCEIGALVGSQNDPGQASMNFILSGQQILTLNGNGYNYLMGTLDEVSDKTLKTNIKQLVSPLQKLLKLNGYTYNWIDQKKSHDDQIGFMAQELEVEFPQLVHTAKDGHKTVAYTHMIPVLVESIKEQQTMIDDLKTENDQLKKDIAAIKAKLGL